MLRLLAALALWLALAGPATAQDARGDWKGVLTLRPGLDLRLAIHITRAPSGAYAGTIDSLDQQVFDKPLTNVGVAGGKLTFVDPAVKASYAATWDASTHAWNGQWTSGPHNYPLTFMAGAYPAAPRIAGLDGEWDGALDFGTGLKLRLAFHIATGPHGTLATFDSVDQGAYGAPVSEISRDGDHVRLDMKVVGALFDAQLVDAGEALAGVLTQNGLKLP